MRTDGQASQRPFIGARTPGDVVLEVRGVSKRFPGVVALDRVDRSERQLLQELRTLFTSLSPRERETMTLLAAGDGVKQIAGQMGVRTHTARVHSSRVMLKMGARSIADLARMADKLQHASREEARSRQKAARISQTHKGCRDHYSIERNSSERSSTTGAPHREVGHA